MGFIDVRGLYVNLDALAEVGQDPAALDTSNWDQLSQLGAQLVKKDGDKVNRWGFDTKIQAAPPKRDSVDYFLFTSQRVLPGPTRRIFGGLDA